MAKFKVKSGTKIKVGDEVLIECHSGLGSDGQAIVTKITHGKIVTEKDGDIIKGLKTIKVIWCNKHAFNAENGRALNAPWGHIILRGCNSDWESATFAR